MAFYDFDSLANVSTGSRRRGRSSGEEIVADDHLLLGKRKAWSLCMISFYTMIGIEWHLGIVIIPIIMVHYLCIQYI